MNGQNKNKEKKHLLYRLFNPQGNGIGVDKKDLEGPDNITKCFKMIGRNITNMFYLNLLLIFGNFPIMFGLFALSGNLNTPSTAAASSLFAPLFGTMRFSSSPVTTALFGVHGLQSAITTPTTWTYVFYALTLLVLFTFGFVNTGVTYIMRSIVRQQPFSLMSDFFYAIKKNLKQSLFMGIIDCVIIGFIIYDLMFFYLNASAMFYVNIIILCIYVMMRYYMYILLITFDLSIWKIFKNSLIFTLLNFKRNIVAFIGAVLIVAIEWMILTYYFPIGIILPFVFLFSIPMFFGAFAAYPKIKEIMIDPQMNN